MRGHGRTDLSWTFGVLTVLTLLTQMGCGRDAPQAVSARTDGATAVEAPIRGAVVPPSDVVVSNGRVDAARLADWPAARFATAGLVPEAAQRAGDPVRGRRALIEEGYVACGLPTRVFRELAGDADVPTLPGREAAADGLPYFMNASTDSNGVEIASGNCLTCHGTALFGELVFGLGNEFLDFTENPAIAVERAGALVRGADESAAWERYADRINAIGPYMTMRTVGTNPANNLTFALMAHRDPLDNTWQETPVLPLPSETPPPVSVPPWWRMAKKHAMFNLGEGRGDHARWMMSASMLCTDTVAELQAIDAYAPDIRAFIASLEPPAWPFALDTALAESGREVFERDCGTCHGVYATDVDGRRDRTRDEYPNRLVPIELVDTDPSLLDHAHGDGVAYIDWFNRSWYGAAPDDARAAGVRAAGVPAPGVPAAGVPALAAPGPGYVAPPLDGVWATAPFLHNGSVPSVRALLDSRSRPVRWHPVRPDAREPDSYDTTDLGWRHVADERIVTQGDDAVAPARVYDTTRSGHANHGHRFGDHLSAAERDAVIEYLKTL